MKRGEHRRIGRLVLARPRVRLQRGTERNGDVGYLRIGPIVVTTSGSARLLVQFGSTPDGLVRGSLMVDTRPFALSFRERLGVERERRLRVGPYYLKVWVNPNRKAARA